MVANQIMARHLQYFVCCSLDRLDVSYGASTIRLRG
jgi:hypothetical protein